MSIHAQWHRHRTRWPRSCVPLANPCQTGTIFRSEFVCKQEKKAKEERVCLYLHELNTRAQQHTCNVAARGAVKDVQESMTKNKPLPNEVASRPADAVWKGSLCELVKRPLLVEAGRQLFGDCPPGAYTGPKLCRRFASVKEPSQPEGDYRGIARGITRAGRKLERRCNVLQESSQQGIEKAPVAGKRQESGVMMEIHESKAAKEDGKR
eukprot:1159284-Pelagomonas_calceolata.AAC.11